MRTYEPMSTPDPISPGRYRRRIVGLGALAFVVTFAIGAAIFIPVVQNDLEDRVGAALADAGQGGVGASFSGQDGTLSCDAPLDDPVAVAAIASDVNGVRVIELAGSCDGATSPSPTVVGDDIATTSDVAGTDPPVAEQDATTTTDAPPATEPETDGIVDIIGGDPLFGELAGLLATVGLDGPDALGGDGPFTLLAPTDAAFDAAFEEFGADAFIALMSDPDTLRTLLLHHATDGTFMSSDFVVGDLDMLDGTPVAVDPDADGGITFTSSGTAAGVDDPATQLDIEASNGVVHAIDRLLVPEGLVLGDVAGATPPTIAASLLGGRLTLTGDVQSEEQRGALLDAARTQIDPANVVDSLAVDPNVALGAADVERLSALITLMVPNLVEGRADLAGSGLGLTGTYVDDGAQVALAEFATAEGIDLVLTPRPTADADAAAALQVELNEFARDNPILFEANSGTLTPEAGAVVDQLAARAARLGGVTITIVGHTDSDGNPVTNQVLSEIRAASVLQALVDRDLDPATLTSTGRGSTQPIIDDAGAENKAASRRVEFVVSAQ